MARHKVVVSNPHDGVYSIHAANKQPVEGIMVYKYKSHWECEIHGKGEMRWPYWGTCEEIERAKTFIGQSQDKPTLRCNYCGKNNFMSKDTFTRHIWDHADQWNV